MKIGILSDSHGDWDITETAVRLLLDHGARRLVHCGDICDERVLNALAGHDAVFVWGNCDLPGPAMRKYVAALNLPWPQAPVTLTANRKRILAFHGHEPAFRARQGFDTADYVLHGHTHVAADRQEGNCRLINPGALHRARMHTVAILDPVEDDVTFYQVETGKRIKI